MKILVTGGAGYIGSHCVYELIDQGYEVVVYDNLSNGSIAAIHPNAIFVKGDVHDEELLYKTMSEHDFNSIIHFAASIVVSESVEKPLDYYYNNVMGVHSVLNAMVRSGLKNIVFSSTAAVYGNPSEVPCKETTLTKPESPYGETKLAAEKMIQWVANANNLNYVIFRYFNVAGAHESGKIGLGAKSITHIIPSAIEAVQGIRDSLTIFGDDYDTKDGTCIRDYIHVTDLVLAHIKGVEYINNNGEGAIINLGTNSGFSVKEIVSTVSSVCGEVPHTIGKRREGDPAVIVASNEVASKLLGWSPKNSLETMIKSDYNWRLSHPKGYE